MAGSSQRPAEAIAGRVVVIGGSAGSIPVLQEIVARLPSTFSAAVFFVVHQSQSGPGMLPEVIAQRSRLPVHHASDGEVIAPGRVYVAQPNLHLLVESGYMRLARGPRENRFRPAIDALFRTAARAYGPRAIGVVLSGWLDDGTLGSMLVKRAGGTIVVQDPHDAVAADMPTSVIRYVGADHVVRGAEIALLLERLANEPITAVKGATPMPTTGHDSKENLRGEPASPDITEAPRHDLMNGTMPGSQTGFTCPQCGGAIWEQSDGKLIHFRCHVGHAYSANSFEAAQDNEVETALWVAYRMLQEKAVLHKRLIDRTVEAGMLELAERYREREREAIAQAEAIRKLLLGSHGGDIHPQA